MFTCPICIEAFSPSVENVVTNCGHVFHKTCLNEWFGRQQNEESCPSCRTNTKKEFKDIFLNYDEDFEKNLDLLRDTLDIQKTQIQDMESYQLEINAQNDALKVMNSGLEDELKSIRKKMSELEKRIAEYEIIQKDINFENEELKDKVADYEKNQKDINSLKNELQKSKKQIEEQNKNKSQMDTNKIMKELAVLKAAQEEMKNSLWLQINKLKEENVVTSKEIATIKTMISESES